MPFPIIAALMGAGYVITFIDSQLTLKGARDTQNEANAKHRAAKEDLEKKRQATHAGLSTIQSGIQAEFDTVMARYRPIMDRFGQAIRRLDVIPKPPGFETIDAFVMPDIQTLCQSISSPELKEFVAGGISVGLHAASDLMAAKVDLMHSMMHAKGGLRGMHAMQSRASKASIAAREVASEVEEYCSDAERAKSVFDEAVKAARKAREVFDQHVALFDRYIGPCEAMIHEGVTSDTITPEGLIVVGYLHTIGESFQKYVGHSIEA